MPSRHQLRRRFGGRSLLSLDGLWIVAYLGAIALGGALPALVGTSHEALASAAAFSPAALAAGELWLLPASGLVVDGATWPQLVTLAALVAIADARTFWRAAVAGHVGSTVVAYGVVAVLLLAAPASVRDVVDAPDYGISCVSAGALGALAVALARRCADRRTSAAVLVACTGPAVAGNVEALAASSGTLALAALAHLLALALGALIASRSCPGRSSSHAGRRARPRLSPTPVPAPWLRPLMWPSAPRPGSAFGVGRVERRPQRLEILRGFLSGSWIGLS